VLYLSGFKEQKRPSNSLKPFNTQFIAYEYNSYAIHSIHDFLFVFHCNYVSILHHFRDIIGYFPKFKDATWSWQRLRKGQFVIPMLNHRIAK